MSSVRSSSSSLLLLSSLKLSDKADAPSIRALLGTDTHFYEVVVLGSSTVPKCVLCVSNTDTRCDMTPKSAMGGGGLNTPTANTCWARVAKSAFTCVGHTNNKIMPLTSQLLAAEGTSMAWRQCETRSAQDESFHTRS